MTLTGRLYPSDGCRFGASQEEMQNYAEHEEPTPIQRRIEDAVTNGRGIWKRVVEL